MISTNARGSKRYGVPNVKNLNRDVDMLDRLNSKYHIDSDSSNHMAKDTRMFSYYTHTRREISSYSNNKDYHVGSMTSCKIAKSTIKFSCVVNWMS